METDGRARCAWAKGELMTRYHDTEWGRPTTDERALYEMFLLETFQAGLSWHVVLSKREAFRTAFDGFDPRKIAAYDERKLAALMADAGIIRCRRKLEAAVRNAQIYLAIAEECGGFYPYLLRFVPDPPETSPAPRVTSESSDRLSGDLKKRGMRYVGSVTIYSYLQAVGLVNDHEAGCWVREET